LTSTSKKYPTRIEVKGESAKGWIMIDQIRTVDRKRTIKILGNLSEKEISVVKDVLRETFVD
jgi:mRNA interferase MazF